MQSFIQDLRAAKVYTSKQCVVIENLFIYLHDSKVYKVILSINPNQIKKAKKLGITKQYTTVFLDDIPLKIKETEKGNYIIIYNVNNASYSIFDGEESEEKQLAKLKRPSPS